MLFDLILFDSEIFWILLAFPAILLCYFVYSERGAQATITLIATLVVLTLFSNTPILLLVKDVIKPRAFVLYIGGYTLNGIVYMCLRWVYHVYEVRVKYKMVRDACWEANIKAQTNFSIDSPHFKSLLEQRLKSESYSDDRLLDLPPKIANHKSDLVFWLSYWPLSLLFTLLGNPLKHLIRGIINFLAAPLNAVSRAMFKDFSEIKK